MIQIQHTYRFWKCSACLVRPCYFVTIDDTEPLDCPYGGDPELEEIRPQDTIRQIARSLNGR